MSQDNIAYERELGNINIRGKRGKKTVPFGIEPVAAEVDRGKIDESKAPDLFLDLSLPNIDVTAKDKSKPLDLGIKPIAAEVDTRKIDKDIPMYVATPTKDGGELPEVIVEGHRQPTKEEGDARRAAYAEKLYSMATPYLMGPQATEDTINKAHSIYDIEKEKQAARDKEKEEANELGRLYVEGRKYGLDKLMEEANAKPSVDKPVIDENIEIIDNTLEEATPSENEKKAAEKDPLSFLTDYAKSLYSEDDRIADEKKKKAAQWILAAQMLGDSIGALSNVYWTGKGANAQKFEPGAQKAAAATYQMDQDIRNAREKAAKAQMDAALKKYEMEMQREREKKADERYNAEQAENKRRYDNEAAYRRERDAIVDAREKELMEFRRQQENRIAKSSRGASTSTKDVEPIEFTLGDGETIGIDKFNKDKLNRLYRSLPEDVRSAIENEEVYSNNGLSMGTKKRKVTDDDRLQAIYDNLDNPEVANAIRKMGGMPIKAKEEKATTTAAPVAEIPIQPYDNPATEWGSQWRRRAGLEQTDFSQYKRK